MSRQDLAEILSECVAAMQQPPRPKMALFVQSAEECAQKSLAAAGDNEAVMWANICLNVNFLSRLENARVFGRSLPQVVGRIRTNSWE